jgi:phosphonate transport system substrate-binding protein
VVNWLKRGKIDLFIDSSITALQVNKLSGSQYMLRRWKKGRGEYRSVIFTRADSTISNLGDLKGQVIAFEEPFSTSGFMLPAIQFGLQGIELESVNSPRDLPSPNVVGTIMAYDNETQVTWVERDMVAAAAISEGDFSDFEKTALEPLRIVQFTEYVPYHVVSQRADLDAELADQIKGTLKRVHETEQGRKMLMEFERTSKFDDIPPKLLSNTLKFEPHLTSLLPVN